MSRFKFPLTAALCLGLLVGCASGGPAPSTTPTYGSPALAVAALGRVSDLATPDKAMRALVMAQDVRTFITKGVAAAYVAHVLPGGDESYKMIRKYDEEFRSAWTDAAGIAERWRAAGGSPNDPLNLLVSSKFHNLVGLVRALLPLVPTH